MWGCQQPLPCRPQSLTVFVEVKEIIPEGSLLQSGSVTLDSLLWLEPWHPRQKEQELSHKLQAVHGEYEVFRLRKSSSEDHISVRQKISTFMPWTKLALTATLHRKAHEGPCNAAIPSGAREKGIMILDFMHNLIV